MGSPILLFWISSKSVTFLLSGNCLAEYERSLRTYYCRETAKLLVRVMSHGTTGGLWVHLFLHLMLKLEYKAITAQP